jgi:hypothetical protein
MSTQNNPHGLTIHATTEPAPGIVILDPARPGLGAIMLDDLMLRMGRTREQQIAGTLERGAAHLVMLPLAILNLGEVLVSPDEPTISEAEVEAFVAELDAMPTAVDPEPLADWERELLGTAPSTPAEPAPAASEKRYTAREVTAPREGYLVTDAQGDGTTGAFYAGDEMRFFGLPIEHILDDLETGDVPFARLTHTATSAYTFADAEEPAAPLAIEGRYVLRYYDGDSDRHFGILDVVEQRFADFDEILWPGEPATSLARLIAAGPEGYSWHTAEEAAEEFGALSEHLVEPAPEPEERFVLRYRPDGGLVVLDRELRRTAGFGYFADGDEEHTLAEVSARPESVMWRDDTSLPVDSLRETREEALASVRAEEPVVEEASDPEEPAAPRYALAKAVDGYTLITDAENPDEVADWSPEIADLAPEWVEGLNDGTRSRHGLGWVPTDRHPVAVEPAKLDDLTDAASGFYTDADGDLWVVPGDGGRPSILTDGISSAVGMYDYLEHTGCGPFIRVTFAPEVAA